MPFAVRLLGLGLSTVKVEGSRLEIQIPNSDLRTSDPEDFGKLAYDKLDRLGVKLYGGARRSFRSWSAGRRSSRKTGPQRVLVCRSFTGSLHQGLEIAPFRVFSLAFCVFPPAR